MRIRRLFIVALFLAIAGIPGARAQLSKTAMTAAIAACFPNQTTGAITPAGVVACLTVLVNSYQQYAGVNKQTGTTYTLQTSDYGQLVQFSGSAPVAVSLPQAIGTFVTWNSYVSNQTTANVTVTPTGSLIGGNSSLIIAPQQTAWIVSDGTNYQDVLISNTSVTITNATFTRSQIPSTTINATYFSVSGYRTSGDLGSGCTYTSVGATSTGLEAIESANGTYFNLIFPGGVVNVGCFGAYGNGNANLIQTSDLTANPAWRGGYTTAWNWDAVAYQEAEYASLASASTPFSGKVGAAVIIGPQGSYFGSGVGCASGTQTFTVVGGTGTAATVSGTVGGGVLSSSSAPLTVVTPGNYTVFPTNPVTLSGGGCSSAPLALLSPSNIVWNSSPTRNETLNKSLWVPCANGQVNVNNYVINQPILEVGAGLRENSCAGTQLNWTGPSTVSMITFDSGSYGIMNPPGWATQNQPSYNSVPGIAPLITFEYDGTFPGLATQRLTINSPVCSTSFNGRCIFVGFLQGSSITFNDLECGGFASDYCALVNGDNALNINFNNKDCQGFTHDCVAVSGGTINDIGGSEENEQTYFGFFPVLSQLTTYGADDHIYYGIYPARVNAIENVDSEGDVGVIANNGSYAKISNYGVTHTSGLYWNASQYLYLGDTLFSQPGCNASGTSYVCVGSKAKTYMVVDDGGLGPNWPTVTGSSSNCNLQFAAASYTTNEWVGFTAIYRFDGGGYTEASTITANTTTSITVSPCFAYAPVAGGQYHIAGQTGSSVPSFDSALNGYSTTGIDTSLYGLSTTAGSNVIYAYAWTTASPSIQVNDYVVIPGADCIGASVVLPMALIAKVTAVNTPSSGYITVNKNACYSIGGGPSVASAYGYWGAGLIDNNITYIPLDYNAFAGPASINPFVLSNVTLEKGFTPSGRIEGISYYPAFVDYETDWLRSGEPGSVGSQPINFSAPGPLQRVCAALTPASTIDLTTALLASDCASLTPAGNETLNFPALTATSQRRVTLLVTTSGTSSYTLTFGSNATSAIGTLATGVSSGAQFVVEFEWNGSNWVEASRSGPGIASPCNAFGSTSGTCAQGNDSRFPSAAVTSALAGTTACASWTPTDQSGASLTFTGVSAMYCQLGNMVFVYGTLTYPSTASGSNALISLPVAVPNQAYAKVYGPPAGVSGQNVLLGTIVNSSTAGMYNFVGGAVINSTVSLKTLNFFLIYPAS